MKNKLQYNIIVFNDELTMNNTFQVFYSIGN